MEKVTCIYCNSTHTQKDGRQKDMQRYRCMDCGKRFVSGAYQGEFTYITHFNTKIKQSERNTLTRENYCTPSREVDYKTKKVLLDAKSFYEKNGRYPLLYPPCYCNIPNEMFSDYEHFAEEYVRRHYEDCMRNFDLNMAFFETLDFVKFDRHLTSFVKRNRFEEITDLESVAGKSGLYILVLDKYKQVYIGKTESEKGVKYRILSHWNGKKEFSRLIFGEVDNSILPIDVFGALDTTRIFVKECKWWQDIDALEQKIVAQFDPRYRLNRVAGGINSQDDSALRFLELINTKQVRNLVDNSTKE